MVGFWEGLWRITDAWLRRRPVVRGGLLLVLRTSRAFSRARVVGLAAESAFFTLISLPALLLGLLGALVPMTSFLGEETVEEIRRLILDSTAQILTPDTVDSVVAPLIDDLLQGVQGGVLSVTFLVSLWSGSRAMNVFIRSITISYGLEELRGWFAQRVLAFVAYLGALTFALLVLPILVAGPDLVHGLLPITVGRLNLLYWPTVSVLATTAVTMLYALSIPVRTPLWRHLPGALLATTVLVIGSIVLRSYLDASLGQVSIYGSLAAPIAILAWLFVMAIAILAGSTFNAEIDAMWPTVRTAAARAEIATRRLERAGRLVRRREQAVLDSIGEANGR
ncbi:YihY/virulence factor BrkB family protein [Nocardiopsis lambiniae]|uniref:YihY/virulence factor BrkB family protein n=1 Tax=Nocardiopsis lambiniae TaxID=3075539 RepID=A0ABU2MA83_9ACTN|nr:YihY/virulence factor BrkB family protein [Nocardiopsis sp. DSM 44743]MDT0329500.1 YihY/virulence factor BrkB family protein [Nocardiopsis sp. DSM 44743]